jgi:hypothetical protein
MTVSKAVDIAPKAKRGRPPGAKDIHPQQKQTATVMPATTSPARDQDNLEISNQYMHTGKTLFQDSTELNDQFAFHISQEIMDEKPDPITVAQERKKGLALVGGSN